MKENKSDYELISESLEEYIDEADEMVLCVYRDKLDTSKITHRHEVVDVHEEKGNGCRRGWYEPYRCRPNSLQGDMW